MAKHKAFNLAFPAKGINTSWPQNSQPTLTTPDALNVITFEPNSDRARGGQRWGTSKALVELLGSDATGRGVTGLHTVTVPQAEDEETSGGNDNPIDALEFFDQFESTFYGGLYENDALVETGGVWTFGASTAATTGNGLSDYLARFDSVRGAGTADWGEVFGQLALATFDEMQADGSVAAVGVGNKHTADNFRLDVMWGNSPSLDTTQTRFVSCRLDSSNPTSTAGVLTLAMEIGVADPDTAESYYTCRLYKGTTLLESFGPALAPDNGITLGISVEGNTVRGFMNGTVVASQEVTGQNTAHRGVAIGGARVLGLSSFQAFWSRAQPTNGYTEIYYEEDFSGITTAGEPIEDELPTWTPGYDDSWTPDPFTLLAPIRHNLTAGRGTWTAGGTAPLLTYIDGAEKGVQMQPDFTETTLVNGAALVNAAVRTPADNFQVEVDVAREGDAGSVGILVRVNQADPSDAEGTIYVQLDASAGFVRILTGSTATPALVYAGNGDNSASVRNTLAVRVEGSAVTALVDGVACARVVVAGQNTTHRAFAICTSDYGQFENTNTTRVYGVRVYQATAAGEATTITTTQARKVYLVAQAGRNVYAGDLTGLDPVVTVGSSSKPSMTDLDGMVYYVNGTNTLKIDPEAGSSTALVASAGTVPANCRGAVTWRGRLVLYQQDDNSQNVYMSKAGDPTDWDYNPTPANALQAVALNASTAGRIGQPVRAVVPFRDDVLVIGCDHSLYAVVGDPADGGTVTTLSDSLGILQRDAWTIAPDGAIYFVGHAGFYVLGAPNAAPVCLSDESYRPFFAELDRRGNYIMCQWDRDARGCWIFVTSIATGESTHLWYDDRMKAFWPQRFPNAQGPMASMLYDGDRYDDRAILLGGRDGYIRQVDPDALNDDGVAIASHVVIGPLNPFGPFAQGKLIELEATTGDGTTNLGYAIHTGEDAKAALAAGASYAYSWQTVGRQNKTRQRARGGTFVLKLTNGDAANRWSVERIAGIFEPAGRMR